MPGLPPYFPLPHPSLRWKPSEPEVAQDGREEDVGTLRARRGAPGSRSPLSLQRLPQALERQPRPPACSALAAAQSQLRQAAQHALERRGRRLETLPHPTWRRGALHGLPFQPPKNVVFVFPHPKGSLATDSSKWDQIFVASAAIGSMGGAHCLWREVEGGGRAGGSWSPGKRERLGCTKAVAGLLDLSGSISKDSTTFLFLFFFLKLLYIKKLTTHQL